MDLIYRSSSKECWYDPAISPIKDVVFIAGGSSMAHEKLKWNQIIASTVNGTFKSVFSKHDAVYKYVTRILRHSYFSPTGLTPLSLSPDP